VPHRERITVAGVAPADYALRLLFVVSSAARRLHAAGIYGEPDGTVPMSHTIWGPVTFKETTRQFSVSWLDKARFLANVNSRSPSLYAIARPSVVCLSSVCNARAPYSGGWNFGQYFYGIWYLGHPL